MSLPRAFQERIRAAQANQGLQAALDANAQRRIANHAQAFATLDDPEALRQQAHAVRAATIDQLDEHLELFASRAAANGMIVHHAADAAQARQLVVEIARENQVTLAAKSKSMVSEEIGLNHALEAAGVRAVETDLGEYIVQLRGEMPGHIITPAVHLNRHQVAQTFHEKLGLPLTDQVPEMTAAARRELRRVFLEAGLGISGVNFGVVETGGLCIITNEGNGRLVTTLPPVHVALMGIERLVPSMEDLALMLTLLPRASTGQKLTVYVNLMQGPRREGDPEGPEQRHLILIDNGRSAMRRSPLAEALLCIRCGACLNACPVFQEIGGHAYVDGDGHGSVYSGPIGSIVSPGLFGFGAFGHLPRASTLCGACREACPVDIDLPKLLLRARVGGGDPARRPQSMAPSLAAGLRAYTWLATRPGLFRAAQRLAAVAARIWSPGSAWMRLPAFTGWGPARRMPRPSPVPFQAQFRSEPAPVPETVAPDRDRRIEVPDTESAGGATPVDLPARFEQEAAALGVTLVRTTAADLPRRILDFLAARGERELLAWDGPHLPEGLAVALTDAGIRLSGSVNGASQEDSIPRTGLTGAVAAVAETGTLVLPGGPGRPLTASLLPETHLAVLRVEDIYEKLPQVMGLRELREASASALVSGPSRTADIEMTLTIGVHGPGEVVVYLVASSDL